jgi:anaerobic magnesium-protoporphyrin IX monomethyl ester cyclase
MRFLLINVPIRQDHPPNNFPTGLGIIAAVLERDGHDVIVLDANAHRFPKEKVVALAADTPVDAIGISGLISTFKYQQWLIDALKARRPETPLIAGGGCATSAPELMMAHTKADYLVIGEGEHTIAELLAALDNRGDLDQVKGIAFRKDGETVFTPPRPLEKNLDNFPLPAYHLFPVDIYLKYPIWHFKEPSMNLLSSRGCPMSCRFCYNLFGRRSYRRRGIDSIIEEVRLLKRNYGIHTFGFVDDNVTINRNHLGAMCNALGRENVTWGCHGRVDTADDERLAIMAASGCKWLGFGIESGSQRILDAMNKRIKVDEAKDAILRTRKHGIFANATFIFGYPGEDVDSIGDTIRFKMDLDILVDSFYATPYPGTELYTEAREKGLIPDEHAYVRALNNAYDFTINLTDMPDEQLKAMKKLAYTELNTALTFKHLEQVAKEKEAEFLALADRFLKLGTFTMESKGEVLLSVARFYESQGNIDAAFRTRSNALRFGVRIDQDAPVETTAAPI